MDNVSEEDLNMMCLFGKKEIRKLETPADIISEVRLGSVLISIFPCLTISEMVFFVFKPPELLHTAPLPISLHDIEVNQTAVGCDFEQAKARLVQLHRDRFIPQLHLDQGHLNFLSSGCYAHRNRLADPLFYCRFLIRFLWYQ